MILFFIIYGVTGAVPLIAALYLLLRRGNAFAPEVTPPVRLRRWAAAFFGVSALGHVWWYLVYITSADCHSMGGLLHSAGYVTAVALDFVMLQTTIAGVLLAMLQDRRRPVWPAFVATIPFMALCVVLLVSPSYQLLQAYDYLTLYRTKGCRLQMGGSDQWGNITTGTELIRRMEGGEAFALTCPLITKADGTKFGKTEGGNVWLDPTKTSPYKFYQFWLNCSDVDAARYIRIFTLLSREEIEECERQHAEAPERRVLQRALAKDITCRVHSQRDYDMAVSASELLFGKGTTEQLNSLDRATMLSVFEGVPQFSVSRSTIDQGVSLIDLAAETGMFASKGEIRRELKQNSISVNKAKVGEDCRLTAADVLSCGSILVQKGKKSYYLLNVE